VVSVVAAAVHPGGSSAVMFTATEDLVTASVTAAVAFEIEGTAFALASMVSSFAVA
jgi:hypothetical protein